LRRRGESSGLIALGFGYVAPGESVDTSSSRRVRPDHAGGHGVAVGFNDGGGRIMDAREAREWIEGRTGKALEELIERQRTYRPAAE